MEDARSLTGDADAAIGADDELASQATSDPREASIAPLMAAPAGPRSTTPTISGTTPVSSSPATRTTTVASTSEPTDAELSTATVRRPSLGGGC